MENVVLAIYIKTMRLDTNDESSTWALFMYKREISPMEDMASPDLTNASTCSSVVWARVYVRKVAKKAMSPQKI